MSLNLHLLRLFATVARTGSFSRAAKLLNISQPAISKGVRDFELQVGCRLLDRTRKGVRPTQEGAALARHAETLFAAAILKCPSDERARSGYAESLWQRGAREQAIEHMEEAVRLSVHDAQRLVRLGQMYGATGDLARAGHCADQAIGVSPELASAWALRGHVQRERPEGQGCEWRGRGDRGGNQVSV